MVLRQGGERAPHELRGRQPPCGEQAGKGQRQSSCDVHGDAGGEGAGLAPASAGSSARGDGEPAGHSPSASSQQPRHCCSL